MKDWIVPILVATIALIGSLTAAFLVHRRWQIDRRSKYRDERRQVYADVWNKVESLNLDLRTERVTGDQYRDRLTDLNTSMLKAGPHLDEADRVLFRQYVDSVEAFLSALSQLDSLDARILVGQTDRIPADVVGRVRTLGPLQDHALALRGKVLDRVRVVLKGSAG